MNALHEYKMIESTTTTEASQMRTQVEKDVAFLQHRIELMKKQRVPNNIVIATYESMLKSRMSVLSWLYDSLN